MPLVPKTYDILVRAVEEGIIAGLRRYRDRINETEESVRVEDVLVYTDYGFVVRGPIAEYLTDSITDALLESFEIKTPYDGEE